MLHPELFLTLHEYEHQDRLREVGAWRLARAARQQRASYVGQFLYRLVSAAWQRLKAQARPGRRSLTLANPPKIDC